MSLLVKILSRSKSLFVLIFSFFAVIVLLLSLRGHVGNPTTADLLSDYWRERGPFELSPERGRFALTYSLAENRSFSFSLPIARFAVPDLGFRNGKYVSLFAPAVSFLVAPGYIIGKYFNISQVGAFGVIALFAIGNFYLIQLIASKLGASKFAGILGACVFLFATPAYSYAVTLYQHHISTFLLLLGVYCLVSKVKVWKLFLVFFLFATSLSVDYPNFFLMSPIVLVATSKFFEFDSADKMLKVKIITWNVIAIFGVILPMVFFLWTNMLSYGNPFQLSGTVPGVREIDPSGKPTAPKYAEKAELEKYFNPELQQKSAFHAFNPRNLLNGFYVHLLSPDRGIIFFAPVLLLGIAGILFLRKSEVTNSLMLIGIIGLNLIIYSMWGDPWGGWAFGSRYLIPSYAILSIFLGVVLNRLRRNAIFLLVFILLFSWSVVVNTAGALSSSANPPQVEVLALEKISGLPQKYTFERNFDELRTNASKSFVFQAFAKNYLNSWQYFEIIAAAITIAGLLSLSGLYFSKEENVH